MGGSWLTHPVGERKVLSSWEGGQQQVCGGAWCEGPDLVSPPLPCPCRVALSWLPSHVVAWRPGPGGHVMGAVCMVIPSGLVSVLLMEVLMECGPHKFSDPQRSYVCDEVSFLDNHPAGELLEQA